MNTFNVTGKNKKQGANGRKQVNRTYDAGCANVADMKMMGDRNLDGAYQVANYHTNMALVGLLQR